MIEVKGTASLGVAWQQLKVSSQNSWRLLVEERIPVYRVSDVSGRSSTLYVLLYGQDFFLEQEARWTFKLMRNAIDRTPSIVKSKGNLEVRVSNERVKGSKYDALREYLKSKSADEVTLQFKDAAEVLGFPLPSSAYKYQAFWANQSDTRNRPWAEAWQEAGYKVDSYRLSESDGWVRFTRRAS
jgi:hypothetical protein